MFGRATIALGIGPHSSFVCFGMFWCSICIFSACTCNCSERYNIYFFYSYFLCAMLHLVTCSLQLVHSEDCMTVAGIALQDLEWTAVSDRTVKHGRVI